jgi:hypothetical protein
VKLAERYPKPRSQAREQGRSEQDLFRSLHGTLRAPSANFSASAAVDDVRQIY